MTTHDIVSAMLAAVIGERPAVRPLGPQLTAVDPEPPPGTIPQTLDELTRQETGTYELTVTAAIEANIPVAGSVGGGFSRRIIVLERAAYKPIPVDDVVLRYGYAIRLVVTVSRRTASMKLTLPFLAASAEVGDIEAMWRLQVTGLAGAKIDEVALPPTELSVESFVLAKQSLEKLIGAVRDPSTTFKAERIAVERPLASPAVYRAAAARAYALGRIERGRSINRAVADLDAASDELRQLVHDAYREFGGIDDPDEIPNDSLRRLALEVLGDIKVEPR